MGRAEDKRQAARDAAAHHGLRAAVPHYLEAAHALVDARKPEEAVDLLGELLTAQERKRGLFARAEKNPLGSARAQVVAKFAELSRLTAPTEDVLELMGELAHEYPDDPLVRRSNADALYQAGYIADASEEYRYVLHLNPDDGQVLTRLSEAYVEMGRNDHAIEYLRRGMRVHAEADDYGQAMHLAIRWLTINPGAAEDVLRLLREWPADAARGQIGGINQLAQLAKKEDSRDAAWHKMVAGEFAQLGATGKIDVAYPAPAPSPRPAAPVELRPAAAPAPAPAKPASVEKPSPVPPPAPAPAAAKPDAATKPAGPPPPSARPATPPAAFSPKPTEAPPPPLIGAQSQLRPAPPRPSTPMTPAASARPPTPQPRATPPAPPPQAPVQPPAKPAPPAASQPTQPIPTLDKVIEEASRAQAPVTPPAPASPAAAKPAPPQPAPPELVAASAAQPPAETEKRVGAGGAAGGIKNFARRKARDLYDAGDFAGASQSLERVLRFGADEETLRLLLRCYAELEQPDDAKRVGMQLADLLVEAGKRSDAVAALTELAKSVPDQDVLKRRSELQRI